MLNPILRKVELVHAENGFLVVVFYAIESGELPTDDVLVGKQIANLEVGNFAVFRCDEINFAGFVFPISLFYHISIHRKLLQKCLIVFDTPKTMHQNLILSVITEEFSAAGENISEQC
jgi:hypothetical protein